MSHPQRGLVELSLGAVAPPSSVMKSRRFIRSPRRRARAAYLAPQDQSHCRLDIDHELKFGRLGDRQIGGLRAPENATHTHTRLATCIENRTRVVSKIAWLLGFNEVSAFTHAFKRWTGKTPREMRSAAHD
jgi:AraC-like DNA-binding protein